MSKSSGSGGRKTTEISKRSKSKHVPDSDESKKKKTTATRENKEVKKNTKSVGEDTDSKKKKKTTAATATTTSTTTTTTNKKKENAQDEEEEDEEETKKKQKEKQKQKLKTNTIEVVVCAAKNNEKYRHEKKTLTLADVVKLITERKYTALTFKDGSSNYKSSDPPRLYVIPDGGDVPVGPKLPSEIASKRVLHLSKLLAQIASVDKKYNASKDDTSEDVSKQKTKTAKPSASTHNNNNNKGIKDSSSSEKEKNLKKKKKKDEREEAKLEKTAEALGSDKAQDELDRQLDAQEYPGGYLDSEDEREMKDFIVSDDDEDEDEEEEDGEGEGEGEGDECEEENENDDDDDDAEEDEQTNLKKNKNLNKNNSKKMKKIVWVSPAPKLGSNADYILEHAGKKLSMTRKHLQYVLSKIPTLTVSNTPKKSVTHVLNPREHLPLSASHIDNLSAGKYVRVQPSTVIPASFWVGSWRQKVYDWNKKKFGEEDEDGEDEEDEEEEEEEEENGDDDNDKDKKTNENNKKKKKQDAETKMKVLTHFVSADLMSIFRAKDVIPADSIVSQRIGTTKKMKEKFSDVDEKGFHVVGNNISSRSSSESKEKEDSVASDKQVLGVVLAFDPHAKYVVEANFDSHTKVNVMTIRKVASVKPQKEK